MYDTCMECSKSYIRKLRCQKMYFSSHCLYKCAVNAKPTSNKCCFIFKNSTGETQAGCYCEEDAVA